MSILIGTVLLWAAGFYLLRKLWRQDPALLQEAVRNSISTALFILPRIAVGLIGAGFLAELLPDEQVASWFGDEAGFQAVVLAALCGPLTPGGPFVAFAIGAAALKAGAGEPALITYLTSWSLICLNRDIIFELPLIGARFMRLRWALSAPVPFLLGGVVMLMPG